MFKKIALPDKREKKRAKAVQHSALLSYVFFVISLIVTSYLIALSIPGILGYATNVNKNDLLNYTNIKRQEVGLNQLVINEKLSSAAESKANDMFRENYWAHTSPSGKEPWDFIIASGYDYLYAGENLAVDFSESKSVVEAWYNSPSHRANLLNDKYTEIGFAVVNGELEGRKTTLIVQMFGYPRGNLAQIPKSNENLVNNQVENNLQINSENQLANENNNQNDNLELNIPVVDQIDQTFLSPDNNQQQLNLSNEEVSLVQSRPANTDVNFTSGGEVLNSATVFSASKYIAILLGLFVTLMFAFDGVYAYKEGIFRISGHTILHIILLLLAVFGIWYTSIGLVL